MSATIRLDGLFDQAKLSAWTTDQQQRIRRGVAAGMREGGARIRDLLRAQMREALQIRRAAFLRVMTYKVFDSQPQRLPALHVGALRAPWLESHELGGIIRGRGRGLLIPINLADKRMGRKSFRRVLDTLRRQGNAWFENVAGRVLLFAEDLPESRAVLQPWRRAIRAGGGGRARRKTWPIAIAVLAPTVRLRRRLKVQETVRRALPLLVTAIERKLQLR